MTLEFPAKSFIQRSRQIGFVVRARFCEALIVGPIIACLPRESNPAAEVFLRPE